MHKDFEACRPNLVVSGQSKVIVWFALAAAAEPRENGKTRKISIIRALDDILLRQKMNG